MATTLDNLLDQALDIRGSETQTQTLTPADEPSGLGAALSGQSGSAASMAAAAAGEIVVTGLTGMTAESVGRFLGMSGGATGSNNDTFLIVGFNSATSVDISDNGTAAGSDANNGALVWTERAPYSLQDDINFRRTQEKLIKGTTNHYDALPTYDRPTAIGTLLDANLSNIASKTTDAKAFTLTRKFENAAAADTNTRITITDTANLPHADAVDQTGVPILDGADAGNLDAAFVEIIDPSIGTSLVIDGRATGTITQPGGAQLVDGEQFVLNDGANPAVTFEFDDNATVVESNVLRSIDIASTDDSDDIAAKMVNAILNAPVLTMTASISTAGVVAAGSIEPVAEPDSSFLDGHDFVLDDGVNAAVTFEFDTNSSVVATSTLRPVVVTANDDSDTIAAAIITAVTNAPVLSISAVAGVAGSPALGALTTNAGGSVVDADTFTIDDGVNAAVVFEFDSNASVVESATLRQVTFTGGDTADQIRDTIITAITNAPSLDITASNGGAGLVDLVQDRTGVFGDIAITQSASSISVIVGMLGGLDAAVTLTNDRAGTLGNVTITQSGTSLSALSGMAAGADAIVSLTETTGGVAGNVAITETVTDVAFVASGMAGGLATHNHRVFGFTEAGAATEPNQVEVVFYSNAIGDPVSTSNPYTWTAADPASIDLYYGYRDRLDLLGDAAFRTTLTNGIIGDAGLSTEVGNLRKVIADGLGPSDIHLGGLLTNLSNFFAFSDLPDATPTVVEALNTLNEQIGDRDYSASAISNVSGLADGQTITASIEALALAIGSSSVVRIIERLAADVNAGTAHTIPGGNTYTLDGTDNGQNMWIFWRKQLQDPGAVSGGNNYEETSTTSITPYTKVKSGDHINYMIYN